MSRVGRVNTVAAFSKCLGVKHGSREQADAIPQQVSATTVGDATHTTKKSEDEAREDKRLRRNSIPLQFPNISQCQKKKGLALWWHQA